jgi:type VI secretion system secreted protein Hcp
VAAADIFLKLDDCPGESKDSSHPDEIQVLSWSWGLQQTGTFGSGGGGGSGKVSAQDFHLSKKLDKSSPNLFLFCCNGKHIAKGVLTVRKAGETPLEYGIYTFSDLIVTSYSTGGSDGADNTPTETVSLNFGKVEMSYNEQDAKGGGKGAVKKGWDIKANVKV